MGDDRCNDYENGVFQSNDLGRYLRIHRLSYLLAQWCKEEKVSVVEMALDLRAIADLLIDGKQLPGQPYKVE